MQLFENLGGLVAMLIGVLTAGILALQWIRTNKTTAIAARTLLKEAESSVAFLFEDQRLVDATPQARALMKHGDNHRSDWENFLTLLSARFPHLRSQCRDLASVGKRTINPRDGAPGLIEAEYWNGLARFTLIQDGENPNDALDPLTADAMNHELHTLRSIGENSPQLIWKRDAEGVLVWANRAYIEVSEAIHPPAADQLLPWPPKEIFRDTAVPAGSAPVIDMHRVDINGHERPIWYEVTSLKRDTDTMYFAVDASAVVFAQDAQRNFVQTLTKTFAQLNVGLAIFDADRQLVLFNPALVDLTTLPTEFLISRPSLFSFLDRLRSQNMIPEPKDYSSWRDQMVELESAAVEGSYHETWSLSTGQTFRVSGKPHPNGAIAFLMEDISDEISLTRKFRSQIDTTNAVIDNLTTAVSVFSSSGSLILANRAYRDLWGADTNDGLSTHDFLDELACWESASAPSAVWIKLKDTLGRSKADVHWNGSIWLDTHIEMICHYAPLPDGNHQISFSLPDVGSEAAGHIETFELDEPRSMSG